VHEVSPIPVLLDELAAFATTLARRLSGEDIDWQRRPSAGEWSLIEVICHLRDVEREVHQARFRALIAADNAFLPGASSDEWVEQRQYRWQNGPQALADFVAARHQTVSLLRSFGPEDEMWRRLGRHAFFGPTTMRELLNLAVGHDQAHWPQINGLLDG
jgi:hypothetical protein